MNWAKDLEAHCCGNCTLRNKKGVCKIDGRTVPLEKPSCIHSAHKYRDNGYKVNSAMQFERFWI